MCGMISLVHSLNNCEMSAMERCFKNEQEGDALTHCTTHLCSEVVVKSLGFKVR